MARGKAHSDEVRAQVMAALLAGQGVMEVAEAYSLPHQTVTEWAQGIDFGEVRRKKAQEFGDLVGDYLRQILITLRLQAEHATDKEWFQKQPASEIAVLHGVLADKGFRILEAMSAGTGGDSATES